MSLIGQNLPRIDAQAAATGEARYAADLDLPGMLHGRLLLSPHAHARIVQVDAHRARALPGVVAVLIADDVLDIDPYHGLTVADRPLLAIDRARFAGEPVAAVAAVDPATAAAALALIDVTYETLPAAATIDAALAEDAPRLHLTDLLRPGLLDSSGAWVGLPGNLVRQQTASCGEVEQVVAAAALVVEGEYQIRREARRPIEPPAAVAQWTSGGLTVYSAYPEPFLLRATLARLFEVPLARVRVVTSVAAGPGDGHDMTPSLLAAALARKAKRPVRLTTTEDEAPTQTGAKLWMQTAATAEGRLLARNVRVWFDLGAYAGDFSPAIAPELALGPYRWQAVGYEARQVYTNSPPVTAVTPFLQSAGELHVDEIARRAGLDPVQIRRQNLLYRGEPVLPGNRALTTDLTASLQTVAEQMTWATPKAAGTGRGVCAVLVPRAEGVSTVLVRMEMDGQATLLSGACDRGVGLRTLLCQIVTAELALPFDQVEAPSVDTTLVPYEAGGSPMAAMLAAQRAARDVRTQLLAIASRLLDLPLSALELRSAAVWSGERRLGYPDLIAARFGTLGGALIGRGEAHIAPAAWDAAIAAVEVAIAPPADRPALRQAAVAIDAGRAINPRLVEVAAIGSAVRGINAVLGEDPALPPAQIVPVILESRDGSGPHGAKGTGDDALPAVAAAALTALVDAGIDLVELRATPVQPVGQTS